MPLRAWNTDLTVPARSASGLVFIVVTLVFLGIAGVTGCKREAPAPAPEDPPPPSTSTQLEIPKPTAFPEPISYTPKIVFLGIDGASWNVMGPLMDNGELPNFGRLRREGAYMPDFETLDTTKSPMIWTSVATGRAPSDHGIIDYVEKIAGDKLIPITSNSRRVPAIWEIASRHRVSVGVVNWWASWPAETVAGYVVTDHANPAFVEKLVHDQRYWTVNPQELARAKRDFYPLDLAPILRDSWIDKTDFPYREMQAFGRYTEEQMALIKATEWNKRTPYSILKTNYASDLPLFRAAIRLHEEHPVNLQLIYIRGPDPIQHYAWDLVEPERYARKSPNLERDRGIVEGVYRTIDTFLGMLLEKMNEDVWLFVASDHGAEPAADANNPHRRGRPGAHTTAAKGIFFLRGPHVKPGEVLERGDPYDLMPTLAWLLGIPLAEELEGTPLFEAFADEFVAARPVRQTDSYGSREKQASMESEVDETMLESLRALGYIE
jgi:hypothetical protein